MVIQREAAKFFERKRSERVNALESRNAGLEREVEKMRLEIELTTRQKKACETQALSQCAHASELMERLKHSDETVTKLRSHISNVRRQAELRAYEADQRIGTSSTNGG